MAKATALIDKAKNYHKREQKLKSTTQTKKLALAYLNREVNLAQVSYALDQRAGSGSVYITLVNAIRDMWDNGEIKLSTVKSK